MATQIQFRIHSVKCQDETGGSWAERFGNDEIYLGGYGIAANGTTTQIAPRSVYGNFDDGDEFVFNPPRVFHSAPLGATYPQEFGVGLVLVERDAGGMANAVLKLANFAQEQIKKKLGLARELQAVHAQAAAVERTEGGLGARADAPRALPPLLVTAVKLAAPVILDHFKRFIVAAFNDDVFAPQHATVALPTREFNFGGGNVSARNTVRCQDHQGIYLITYDWQLV